MDLLLVDPPRRYWGFGGGMEYSSPPVGLAALALLIWTLRKAKLKYFAIYCFLIGIITLLAVLWNHL